MTREDLYVIPNLPPIVIAIVLCGVVGLTGLGASSVVTMLMLVLVAVGWQGRTKLGYRWQDSAIASWVVTSIVFVCIILLNLLASILSLIPSDSPAKRPLPTGPVAVLVFIIGLALPIIATLIGHAAAKYLAQNATSKKVAAKPVAKQKTAKRQKKQ